MARWAAFGGTSLTRIIEHEDPKPVIRCLPDEVVGQCPADNGDVVVIAEAKGECLRCKRTYRVEFLCKLTAL